MKKALIAFVLPSHMPGYGGWGNGYVAIPEGHPCFGLDYDQIHDRFDISIHGGLTYANPATDSKKRGEPKEVQGMWVVGFDTLHLGDDMGRWPNKASVMRETKRLKEQLEAISELTSNSKPLSNEK